MDYRVHRHRDGLTSAKTNFYHCTYVTLLTVSHTDRHDRITRRFAGGQ